MSELKRCPRCEESKPLGEFGVCQARKDGLNLYCKRCIRQKIAASRLELRAYKAARLKAGLPTVPTIQKQIALDFSPRRVARLLRKLSPSDRVREAIRCGARTQKEIAHVTRLSRDQVCDCLANLLLWTREIRTQVINHSREYLINDVAQQLLKVSEAQESQQLQPREVMPRTRKVRAA